MDHLTALRVFREVVRHNGFAAAGRKLGLSSPAVSKNVSELEAHLSARLLNRTTRRLSLTEAGARYYAQIGQILDDLDETERSLNPSDDNPAGTLRVSAPVSLTLHHVVCASPDYFARHGRPAAPDDLRAHTCIQFSLSGHANEWTFRKGDDERRIPVDGRYKVSSSLAVRDALRAGFGLTLIPCTYVQDDLARGTLTTALDDWHMPETGIFAVYPSRRHLDAKVRAFVDFLVDALR